VDIKLEQLDKYYSICPDIDYEEEKHGGQHSMQKKVKKPEPNSWSGKKEA